MSGFAESGLQPSQHSFSATNTRHAAFGDYDNDGWIDLLVGNYGQANELYRNRGGLPGDIFEQIHATTTCSIIFEARGTNRVVWGDFDGDGWIDAVVANLVWSSSGEENELHVNRGTGIGVTHFEAVLSTSITTYQTRPPAFQATYAIAVGGVCVCVCMHMCTTCTHLSSV